jgi:hypothetical protein
MKNDFVNIYKVIEPKEQEAFHHYLQCFYGNQKAVLSIFEKTAQALDADAALEEMLLDATSTSRKNILNAFSDLKKWLLEFLATQEVRQNTTESKFLMLEALRKRGLYDVFQQKSKHLIQELDKQKSPDIWHLFWKVRLSHINYFSLPLDRLQDYQDEMFQLLHDLDNFYMGAKLKYSTELYSRSSVLDEQYEIPLLEHILSFIDTGEKLNPIIKDLYLPLFELAKNDSEQAYNTLKSFLYESSTHEPIERLSILLYLLNSAVRRFQKGEEVMIRECFNLYQFGLDQSLFIANGYFSTGTFLNITNFGCHLKEYDWLRKFVKQWSLHLYPIDKDETIGFTMARIAFEEKQFKQVIELLRDIDFKNISFTLNVRLLLIRAYYEQREPTNLMLDYSNALYLYVYRNKKMGSSIQTRTINFVKVFRQLINGKSKKQLFNELEKKEKFIMCYDWLKAKIEERPY